MSAKRWRVGRAVAAAIVLLAAPGQAAGQPPAGSADASRVTFAIRTGGDVEWAVLTALTGAHQRLGRPACEKVLSDFADADGRPLDARLRALGETPASYLARLLFYDGSQRTVCRQGLAVATSIPGSPVVFICKDRFRFQQRNNPAEVELAMIHEMLHSLGLGENPPSSEAINAQVMRRCR